MVGRSKELEILISPDGTVHVETKGIKGKECVDFVKFLEDALGGDSDRKLKPEYYEREGYTTGEVRRDA